MCAQVGEGIEEWSEGASTSSGVAIETDRRVEERCEWRQETHDRARKPALDSHASFTKTGVQIQRVNEDRPLLFALEVCSQSLQCADEQTGVARV